MLDSVWGDVQPNAGSENAFLESHSWDEYGAWYLGLTDGANEDTKARYAFVYGDLRRVHRMGLIACQYRAAEWRHTEIELAAHELLQHQSCWPSSRSSRRICALMPARSNKVRKQPRAAF